MKYFILLIIACTATSCFKERIELNLNDDNTRIAIVAWITDLDEDQYITVSRTTNYLGEQTNDFVDNAIVTLTDGSQEYSMTIGNNGKYYLSDGWQPIIGANYTLNVTVDDQTYTASHLMRPCPSIVNTRSTLVEQDSIDLYGTVFDFQENMGDGDAYYAIDYLKGSAAGDSLINGSYADDEFVDSEYFEDIEISEEDRLFEIGDTAVIELYSIGQETFRFLTDIESEIFRGGPFDAPPANVRTNFSGNAVGYFIISGGQQVELIIQ